MVYNRPLLDPSPRDPSPSPHSDLPGLLEEPPLRDQEATQLPPLLPLRPSSSSTSRRNNNNNNNNRDESFRRSGSRATRYGSRRTESDGFASSLKDIPDDEARLVYINDPDRTLEESSSSEPISGNSIRTSKYTLLSFLPRNLFEQFHRVAYVYFLIIAILNQLPMLAVFGRTASLIPLAFVLLVTAVKDGYEDWRRHRSDRVENSRPASVLTPTEADDQFSPKKPWKDVRVGEIVKVTANETLPCDMVLLSTSDPTGVAYIQTVNLDGESNLKTRYAKQETQIMDPQRLRGALIRCERPNRNIYGFLANLELEGGRRSSLGTSNIVLRGCELKNTAWAVGVAVYAGRDTKVMLNGSGAQSKRSRLETHMNRETIFLSIILFCMCALVATLHGVWLGNHKAELDLAPFYRRKDFSKENGPENYDYYGIAAEVVFAFLSSVIVFQIMIPIALYISIELVRLGQAYFMTRDGNLYDETSNSRFQCRALNINEDLGQIKYVFSDKTGTLTENKMEFRYASIAGVDYRGTGGGGNDIRSAGDGQILKSKMEVETDPELVECLRSGKDSEQGRYARDFLLALATCNTIVPLMVETSDPSVRLLDYQGESPDEQALAYAAASYGFVLVERTSGHIVVDVLGARQRFDVLGLHEFDSDRKRMSVIIRSPDKLVKLFVKGADSSMFGVLDMSCNPWMVDKTKSHLNAYSSVGLRTLVVGMKELTDADFKNWESEYQKASTALLGRAVQLKNVAINIECDLHILGATGIEDKLQKGVPEAIESLRLAGMKVWVLTGDKQETAISIGKSCKLLANEMIQIIINSNSWDSCKRNLEEAVAKTSKISSSPYALVIDGTSLVYILETDLEEELFKVATACDVVLCCRVAPLQKAGIVSLVKKRTDDMTLAIGDGANDVSMIQMADVGIGISGQEGRQAVMASDFAMGQFRFVVPLLLVHGHWNYHRMAYMILYNFYRNSVFVIVLFWYVLYTAFSLTTAITDWSTVLYSIIYTALPTIIVGIFDKDLRRTTLLKYPRLYGAGQREERYNLKLFCLTMLDSLWQSMTVFFVPYLAYRGSTVDRSSIGDVFIIGVVILVNLHLAMDVFRWYWVTHAAIWGCTVATVIAVMVIDSIPALPGYWAVFHTMGTGLFWAILLMIFVAGMLPRFVVKVVCEYFWPNDVQIARESEKFENSGEVARGEVEMGRTSNQN